MSIDLKSYFEMVAAGEGGKRPLKKFTRTGCVFGAVGQFSIGQSRPIWKHAAGDKDWKGRGEAGCRENGTENVDRNDRLSQTLPSEAVYLFENTRA
ncbi:hypothetical protein AA0313_2783 [Acetobacter indonesiensis NRIC 0313]|nr:hypothetical protein AA0313_2783 [Acetobacter indonesiensis NRIC 0313]